MRSSRPLDSAAVADDKDRLRRVRAAATAAAASSDVVAVAEADISGSENEEEADDESGEVPGEDGRQAVGDQARLAGICVGGDEEKDDEVDDEAESPRA